MIILLLILTALIGIMGFKLYKAKDVLPETENEYRIIKDNYNGYQADVKNENGVWTQLGKYGNSVGTNTSSSVRGAKKIILKHIKATNRGEEAGTVWTNIPAKKQLRQQEQEYEIGSWR